MTSDKMLAANKKNAQFSTGPKTSMGKQVVRFNAIKHGARAEHLLLPGEKAETLQALKEGLKSELDPQGAVQSALFDQIVSKVWRLRRLTQAETGALSKAVDNGLVCQLGEQAKVLSSEIVKSRLLDYEVKLENSLYKVIAHYMLLKDRVCL